MKRIFITGAASGLGLALATYYSAKGWAVCIADIQVEAGEALAEKLKTEYKQDCFFIKLDVTSEDEWHNAAAEVGKRWQGLDCLVNNAGVGAGAGWKVSINVMLLGVGFGTFQAIEKMGISKVWSRANLNKSVWLAAP